jgi:elongation factor Ts
MADITASMVRELRERTGVAMMDCKAALNETGGDLEKAVDHLRKKGKTKQDKLASRQATEGRIVVLDRADGKASALVEINCNTDFTAKSEPVAKLAAAAVHMLLQKPGADVAQDSAIAHQITAVAQQTGENVRIGRAVVVENAAGSAGSYLYITTGKIGVLMSFGGKPNADLVKDLGGHIAFNNPLGLTRAEVPADIVARERDIAVEQAKATGKPQNIAEKIAEGKLNSFYAERVLLDQAFYNPAKFKGSIAKLLEQNSCTLEKYVRVEIGR